jgi:hypothetical protein
MVQVYQRVLECFPNTPSQSHDRVSKLNELRKESSYPSILIKAAQYPFVQDGPPRATKDRYRYLDKFAKRHPLAECKI